MPLQVDYSFSPGMLNQHEHLEEHPTLWRYQAFLPSITREHRVSIGEGQTPLTKYDYEGIEVFLKDETGNPTGSFKDRGMCLAITMARALGIHKVALPSAGNAAISATTYALAAGMKCKVYLPETIPDAFVQEVTDGGAEVVLAGKTIAEASAKMAHDLDDSWFNLSTLKEPYRVEGKKTMGLEIAEQLDWQAPDVVIYPTGGGTGLIGIHKAYEELRSLDWVRAESPKMVAVQTEGCAPVVKAFAEGASKTEPWPNSMTSALGLNVPSPLGGAWMLDIIKKSGGTAVSVPESEIGAAQSKLAKLSGLPVGPEAAVAWRGMEKLIEDGWIKTGQRVVVLITGDDRRYK